MHPLCRSSSIASFFLTCAAKEAKSGSGRSCAAGAARVGTIRATTTKRVTAYNNTKDPAPLDASARIREGVVVELHLACPATEIEALPQVFGPSDCRLLFDHSAANGIGECREAGRHRQRGACRKLRHCRTRQPFELTIRHSNRVAVRTTAEHDLRIAGERRIDADPLAEQRPEWRHRAGLALAIRREELGLER